MRRNASTWVSFQMPRSYGEIRPSGETAVASTMAARQAGRLAP